jgi:hypothetical protein
MALYPDDVYCVGCGHRVGTVPGTETPRPERTSRIVAAVSTGGHARLAVCPGCGVEVLPGDKFCQGCGATLTFG